MHPAEVLTTESAKGLPFDILRAYGIREEVIGIWKKSYGDFFLPIQEKAIIRHNVLNGRNVIIFAPTSSGKTLVGEIVSVHYAMAKKRALYLVPMKVLAEEKYHQFRETYGELGVKTIISTHDRKEYDQDLERKEFHIAVVVFEKLNALFVKNPNLLEGIGLVVVDELQMVRDETRGAGLELLLTKFLLSPFKPQLLGLSAVLGDAESLARWLKAELLIDTRRPVELRKGILSGDRFTYLEHNSGKEGEEKWPLPEAGNEELSALCAAKYLAEEKGERVLATASLIALQSETGLARLWSDTAYKVSGETKADVARWAAIFRLASAEKLLPSIKLGRLLPLLNDPDPDMRSAAALVAGQLRSTVLVPELEGLLGDESLSSVNSRAVAQEASEALDRIADKRPSWVPHKRRRVAST